MSAKHGMARGSRGGFGKNSYNQLPWDAAGDDCSPASTLGSSGQSKHMKINWATIAYNRNQVKQKASTCKWFRSSVKYIWGLKHASVPKCGETCFAEPTTSLSKYSVGLSWFSVGRWPAYYFFNYRVYQLSHEIYMFAGVRSAAKVNNIGTLVDSLCQKYNFCRFFNVAFRVSICHPENSIGLIFQKNVFLLNF